MIGELVKQNIAINLICLICLCSCTGLSLGDGSDMMNSSDTWQDASLLKIDPGIDSAAADANGAPPGSSQRSDAPNLQISGTKFNDLNGDGLRAEDEAGLPGWTIILKTEGMDYLQATTDDIGRYSFANLSPGIYTVSENNVTGWNQTSPGNGGYEIDLVDKDAINYDFGNHYGPIEYIQKIYPIMPRDAWLVHSQGVKRLIEAQASNATNIMAQANLSFPAAFSLLNHVPYVPSERDQGSCGNCWVWGCTAPIEVANYFQNGVSDRLSIQYFDSNYNGGTGFWACCGGWEGTFTDFYSSGSLP
jgi:SdrD B-like domain